MHKWLGDTVLHIPIDGFPDSKVHGANMGPTWVLSAPGEPHVGLMNLAIWVTLRSYHMWSAVSGDYGKARFIVRQHPRPIDCRPQIWQPNRDHTRCSGFVTDVPFMILLYMLFAHWGRDKITFWRHIHMHFLNRNVSLWEKFDCISCLRFQLTIRQHWFRQWFGADQKLTYLTEETHTCCWSLKHFTCLTLLNTPYT